ncbi:ATP-dependent DNA helicase PIF1 [Rhizophagus irregularis DAOM 181602=DAOM 197198]|nr:ATP-dependent DNA helicase PIF1 [Rhizophagus irregularis DAOM 181602=DAOM 197198]
MSIALKELIYSVGQQEYVENFDHGIAFFQTITLEDFSGSAKEIADNIRNLVCESDGYYYIFNCDYQSKKKEPISSFWYKCSQNSDLTKRARKIENLSKQRDKLPITRYDCNGILKIAIDINSKTADIQLYHDLIHDRPERISVNQEIRNFIGDRLHQTPAEIFSQLEINNPNLTQKQCHYWWTILIKKQYQKDLDQLKSSLLLLEESNKEIIMQNIVGNVKYLAFIMPFFNKLIHNQEILIDATYKTNALNFELYAVIGQIDGARFAAAYLFLDNAKKDEGVRTEILTAFLTNLKKLADNSEPKYNAYNPIEANSQFSFIDILWCPIIPPNLPFIFCPKTLQVKILELFTKHFHLHPLIPIGSGEFLSSEDIWKLLTEEMYNFCYENDLKYVWAYMWCNWYKFNLWVLWARAADPEKICIFKTTIEAMYNKYKSGREKVSWRKEFKKCWKNLAKQEFSGKLYYTNTDQWICSCLAFLNNRFFLCKHLVKSVNNIITIEFFNIVQRQGIYPLLGMVPEEQNYFNGTLLNKVAGEKRSEGEMEGTNITEGAEDTEDVEGVEEVERMKAVDKNFDGVRKLVNDITKFNRRITNPRTWKDNTNSTMYLE